MSSTQFENEIEERVAALRACPAYPGYTPPPAPDAPLVAEAAPDLTSVRTLLKRIRAANPDNSYRTLTDWASELTLLLERWSALARAEAVMKAERERLARARSRRAIPNVFPIANPDGVMLVRRFESAQTFLVDGKEVVLSGSVAFPASREVDPGFWDALAERRRNNAHNGYMAKRAIEIAVELTGDDRFDFGKVLAAFEPETVREVFLGSTVIGDFIRGTSCPFSLYRWALSAPAELHDTLTERAQECCRTLGIRMADVVMFWNDREVSS
jgi:hypothetical protein